MKIFFIVLRIFLVLEQIALIYFSAYAFRSSLVWLMDDAWAFIAVIAFFVVCLMGAVVI